MKKLKQDPEPSKTAYECLAEAMSIIESYEMLFGAAKEMTERVRERTKDLTKELEKGLSK